MMFFCKECGNETVKWEGRCRSCQEWGTLVEIKSPSKTSQSSRKASQDTSDAGKLPILSIDQITEHVGTQFKFKHRELKNLFSGGLYAGSSYLISGEPGVGKSTFLLLIIQDLCSKLSNLPTPPEKLERKKSSKNTDVLSKILYVCGEETLSQVKKRMDRVESLINQLFLTEDTNVRSIEKKIFKDSFQILLIDSIQTIYDPEVLSAPGSINQTKLATQEIINFCRLNKIVLVMTGHINKSGDIAGPKLIEHLVDSSFFIYPAKSIGQLLELRVISALKNRYGSGELSTLLTMSEKGLKFVTSELLTKNLFDQEEEMEKVKDGTGSKLTHTSPQCGTCIFPHFIGRRLLFYEIECLVTPTKLSIPRRSVEGISLNRLNRILAIMEKYCGLDFSAYDVFVQVTGGFKGDDLLIDLSLIAGIFSSLTNFPLPKKTIFLGEVGLSGKIKRIPDLKQRTQEIDSYGQFLYYASHLDHNQVVVVKDVQTFLEKLKRIHSYL